MGMFTIWKYRLALMANKMRDIAYDDKAEDMACMMMWHGWQ